MIKLIIIERESLYLSKTLSKKFKKQEEAAILRRGNHYRKRGAVLWMLLAL